MLLRCMREHRSPVNDKVYVEGSVYDVADERARDLIAAADGALVPVGEEPVAEPMSEAPVAETATEESGAGPVTEKPARVRKPKGEGRKGGRKRQAKSPSRRMSPSG